MQDAKASMALLKPPRGRICKLCDRKFFIKEMVWNSGIQIKAQNQTIDNALRQARQWQTEIEAMKITNHDKIMNERKKGEVLDIEIERHEQDISKFQNESTDFTQEIDFNTEKEKIFKQQLTDIRKYNE